MDIKQSIKNVRWVRAWRQARYEKRFAKDAYGSFRGVFRSFEDAMASAPTTKKHGFDCPEFGAKYRDRMGRVFLHDYPVLYWLRRVLADATSVFDLGGHVGVHFYAYAKYLSYPAELKWTVCDVPGVTKVGEELARNDPRSNQLRFTNRMADVDGADVVISSGALQYIEAPPLAELLAGTKKKPRHLLISKTPLYDGERFVTLQNAGVSFVPQHVFNRQEFTSSLTSIGYEVVDAWDDPIHSCSIPFAPDRVVRHYSGLYLALR